MFAIITFRDTGPIKSWSAMRATNIHNARTKPLPHAMLGAPKPRHLIGTGNLERDAKRLLRTVKINPDAMRKNGVIAYEAILTASGTFFDRGTADERRARIDAWTDAQVKWATDRYKSFRIASMVLHEDEKTPHIHLVVLPLDVKTDNRFKDREVRWSLVGRTISGPGKFDEAQDVYADAMESFGLRRGVKGSGRKHEPVPIYVARMAAKERELDDAREVVRQDTVAIEDASKALSAARQHHAAVVAQFERDSDGRRVVLARERETMLRDIAVERRARDAERDALKKAKADHEAKVAEDARQLAADRAALAQQLAGLSRDRMALGRIEAQQRADAAKMKRAMEAATSLQNEAEQDRAEAAVDRVRARAMADKIELHRKHLLPTFQAAADFRKRAEAVRDRPLTLAAVATRNAAVTLQAAAQKVAPPAHEIRPAVLASYALIQQRGESIGM